MRYIVNFSENILKKYKRSVICLYNKMNYGNSETHINSFFEKNRNKLSEKINCILKYDETDLNLFCENQWEYALPGFKKYLETGYYKYMFARYFYSIKYIKNKCILDAGCGLGWGSYLISDYPREIILIDINEKAINFAKEKWDDTKLNFKKHSVLDLDTSNKKFDVIVGFELIELLTFSEGNRYLEQVFNNLNKRGVLILSSSFPDSEEEAKIAEKQNKYHLKIFTKSELKTIAREIGFRRINVTTHPCVNPI